MTSQAMQRYKNVKALNAKSQDPTEVGWASNGSPDEVKPFWNDTVQVVVDEYTAVLQQLTPFKLSYVHKTQCLHGEHADGRNFDVHFPGAVLLGLPPEHLVSIELAVIRASELSIPSTYRDFLTDQKNNETKTND